MPISDPTDITGCTLWLDADDAGSITLSGAEVTTWADKSGNGFDFTNTIGGGAVGPTYTAATLNGKAVCVWDNGNQGLRNNSITFTQPWTWFFVINFAAMTGDVMGVFQEASTNYGVVYHPVNSGSWFAAVTGAPPYPACTFEIDEDTPYYITTVFNGASSLARWNGNAGFTSVNIGTNSITGDMYLGQTAFVSNNMGDAPGSYIAEVIAYDTALSSGDYLDVEDYLFQKWFVSGEEDYAGVVFRRRFQTISGDFS